MEEKTFTLNDVFIGQMKHYDVKLFYIDYEDRGLGQSVKINSGVITKRFTKRTFSLEMNPNMAYEITIADPTLQFSSYNRDSIPTSSITLKKNAGFVSFFLKEMLFVYSQLVVSSFSYS